MLTSPALLSMVSSRSASTRAISTRSAGAASRPGSTGALLSSRLETDSSLVAVGAGSCGVVSIDTVKSGGAAAGVIAGGSVVADRAVVAGAAASAAGAADVTGGAGGAVNGVVGVLPGVANSRICAINAV